MSDYKQRTLDFLNIEWATYIERFNRWPAKYGAGRVKEQGYERFRDMLAHILAWWEEGMSIILAVAEGREYERRKYDFNAFNAEAIAKYKDWDEAEFLIHFEKTRQKAAAGLRSMNEAAWDNRRVRAWINGVFIHHAREHLVALSRFLAMDTLKNEWADYVEKYNKVNDKDAFLKKQGVVSFHDLLAHIIGWWEEGARIVGGILDRPGFTWQDPDTDTFNVELTRKYKDWPDDKLLNHYEAARLATLDLVAHIPEDAFFNKDIEGWLAADVVGHYDDHTVDG